MSIFSKPHSAKSRKEYDRIFTKAKELISEGRLPAPPVHDAPEPPKPTQRVIDAETGCAPTVQKKNRLYAEWKRNKELLPDLMCTVDETKRPTEENVQKMMRGEMGKGQKVLSQMRMLGKAIGMESNDLNFERYRRPH